MAKRRPHLARTVIGLLGVLALWVVAAWLAAVAVGRPAVRSWMAGRVASALTAALHQPASVGDVRIGLVPPRLSLSDVQLGPAGAPLVKVRRAEVALGGLRLAEREVVVDQVRLTGVVVSGAVPAAAGSGGRQPWFSFAVRQLEVEDVHVEALKMPDGAVIRARGVQARWSGTASHPVQSAVLHVGRFDLEFPGFEPVSGTFTAWGRRDGDAWRLGRARGSGPGWEADVHGLWRSGVLSLEGAAGGDLSALERTLHLGAGLVGRVAVEGKATVAGGGFKVDVAVHCPRVDVVGFSFHAIEGEAHISPDGLEATLTHMAWAGGELHGSYVLESFAPPWRHHAALRGRGVEIAGLLGTFGVDGAGLAGRMEVNAEADWDGTRIKEGVGTAVCDVAPGPGDVPVAGRVAVSLEADGAMHMSTADLTVAGAPVQWEGRLTLGSWIPSWSVRGEGLPVPAIDRMITGWLGRSILPPALHGDVAVDLMLRGPFNDITVTGDVAAAPLSLGPVDVDSVDGSFQVGQGTASFDGVTMRIGRGTVTGSGTLRYGEGGSLDVRYRGHGVPVRRVVAWGGVQLPVAGTVAVDGTLTGTVERPAAAAALRLADTAVAGIPFGSGSGRIRLEDGVVRLDSLAVGPLTAGVEVDLQRRQAVVNATLRRFGLEGVSPVLARLAGGALDLDLHGSFPFDRPAGRLDVTSAEGIKGSVSLDGSGLRVELDRPEAWHVGGALEGKGLRYAGDFAYTVSSLRLLARDLAGADVPLDGSLAGRASVALESGAPAVIDGAVERMEVAVQGDRAVLASPARFKVVGSAVEVPGVTLQGEGTNVTMALRRSADGHLAGRMVGQVPAALVGVLWKGATLGGRVQFTMDLSGTDTDPTFQGTARVADGSLLLPDFPLPVSHIDGTLSFVPEAIRMAGIRFSMAGGEGTCDGRITLAPRIELDLTVKERNVRWPQSAGFQPSLSGTLRITGPLDALTVSGDTVLQRTVFREDVNLQTLVVQQLTAPARATPEENGAVNLNLSVDVPSTLELNTPIARVTLRGQLRVVGTSAQPGLLGRLEVAPGGELELSGVRYDIDRGTVSFSDPERIDPFLDVQVRATVDAVEITVGLVGTLDRLTPTLVSNPPLPETDILALLSTGRRADQATQAQAGAVASSFLTDQLAGAVTRRARSLLDVDQLRVDPFAATETGSPTARLTVVKQLSRDWTVTVSTNLASNREEVIQSRWRVSPTLYLEASRDVNGFYSLDVKWRRRY